MSEHVSDFDGHERQGATPAAFFSERVRRGLLGAAIGGAAALRRLLGSRPFYNVLRIELSGDVPETAPEVGLDMLRGRGRSPDLLTLLAGLRAAREDPDLGLVLLDVHGLGAGWACIQSVRRALFALRAAGKRVWCYLPQPGMRDYYLASAADRVFLAPSALFDATGLASEVVFLKGALDKLGIETQLARAGRFKSAAEPLTRTDLSPEHREMLDALLDDLYAQLTGEIAAARGVAEPDVRAALADGPLLAAEALRRRLVDALAYPDEIEQALDERFGTPAPIDFAPYRRRRALALRRAALHAPAVGWLAVTGAIVGDGVPGGAGAKTGNWRTFRRELDEMARDRRLRAIIVRVDSPGGSGLASDLMWREIVQARRVKPVVVSMGDVAASGGYYLAAAADHVTAEAATLTGSIGVLAGKPVLRGLYAHLGVTKELVVRGNAARHSDYVPLDEANLGRLRAEAEAFYEDFVGKVAEGRHLTPAAVQESAEGRVWTGRQALARGLVDALGGIEQALDEVKRRLGLPPAARVALDRRPRARSFWPSRLVRLLPGGATADALDVLAPILAGERVLAAMPFTLRFVEPGGGREAGGISPESLAAAALGIPWMLGAGSTGDRDGLAPAALLAGALRGLTRRATALFGPPLVF